MQGVWKMACMHILEQMETSLTSIEKAHLREMYIYSRGVMVAHSTSNNVLMGSSQALSSCKCADDVAQSGT